MSNASFARRFISLTVVSAGKYQPEKKADGERKKRSPVWISFTFSSDDFSAQVYSHSVNNVYMVCDKMRLTSMVVGTIEDDHERMRSSFIPTKRVC